MNGGKQGLRACAVGAVLLGMLVGKPSDAGAWATITVNSLADPGAQGICALRDAITAANTMTATNGCNAGKGHDTIQFSVTGTIKLADTLPEITDVELTINGPPSPGITISGGGKVQVMQVASGATLNLKNATIAEGSIFFVSLGSGGGIENQGTLTVTNSTFLSNRTNFVSGGIDNQGTLTVTNTTFSGNSADFSGGAIFNEPRGTLTVINSTFSGNTALTDTGGITNTGTLTLINSTFSGNTGGNGGAIGNSFFGRGLIIINCTFSGNIAVHSPSAGGPGGGGISNGGTLTVINSTFSGNTAEGGVGGDIESGGSGLTSLKSTILAASSSSGNCFGNFTDLGYNISDDDSCGFTAVGSLNNTDPMLDPAGLANNGGPTQTIALLSGSAAIDAIPVAECTDQQGNRLTTDQRGFPRPDNGEGVCDIGAYEFQDFAGDPGKANCMGRSMSGVSLQYHSLRAAAFALGFGNVRSLQTAIIVL
jgi:predicted outer membrane repeat protein